MTTACLMVAGCSDDYYREYLEKRAGFVLPDGVRNVEHFTGSDIAFTSHYTIPVDSIQVFAESAGLRSEPTDKWDPILFTEQLTGPWNIIPESGSFLYGTGTMGWNSWDLILEMETGDLWTTMYFTDASGDPPD